MEYFHCEGGHRPYFRYRIRVLKCTEEMYDWCLNYNTEGKHFRRFHVEWGSVHQRTYDIFQFEWEEPAILFALKFGVK